MEDAHATVLNLDEKTGDEKASFFAVYDGHGGQYFHNSSAFLKDSFHSQCLFLFPNSQALKQQNMPHKYFTDDSHLLKSTRTAAISRHSRMLF